MIEGLEEQLASHFANMPGRVYLQLNNDKSEVGSELLNLATKIAKLSDKIILEIIDSDKAKIGIGDDSGIRTYFSGLPMGHEFSSFILAILQAGGLINQSIDVERIKKINKNLSFTVYFSESCQNCPEVVQALSVMSIVNQKITTEAVNGANFESEVSERNIMSVPSVFLNNELFFTGRMSLNNILDKFIDEFEEIDCDLAVIGAGPAGISASIYAARKGIKVALIGERLGGQLLDTLSIENYPGSDYTEGPKLASELITHAKKHDLKIVERKANKIEKINDIFNIYIDNGLVKSRAVILATGAKWRDIGVKGEQEFKNKGIAYCSHCDGPLFKDKYVAVIGGGNSGVESALDLSNLARKIYLIEYDSKLRADKVLIEKLNKQKNVEVILNAKTLEITGKENVNGLRYLDMELNEEKELRVDGVFIQIGLQPNTQFLIDSGIKLNERNEVVVNEKGKTNIDGIFAAGDASNTPYKQIVIAAGTGSVASLSAFEYLN